MTAVSHPYDASGSKLGRQTHQECINAATFLSVTIPNPHGGRDIGINLLKIVLDGAGISREQ
jgi:hypothetical protein